MKSQFHQSYHWARRTHSTFTSNKPNKQGTMHNRTNHFVLPHNSWFRMEGYVALKNPTSLALQPEKHEKSKAVPLLPWVSQVTYRASTAASWKEVLSPDRNGWWIKGNTDPGAFLRVIVQPAHNEVTITHCSLLSTVQFPSIVVANAELTCWSTDKVHASLCYKSFFVKDRRDNNGPYLVVRG